MAAEPRRHSFGLFVSLWRIFYALSLKEAAPSAQLILFTFADIVDTVGRRDLSCADMTTESARRI